jgi:uncharacterized membrane protein
MAEEWFWQSATGSWPKIAIALSVVSLSVLWLAYRGVAGRSWRKEAAILCKVLVFALLLLMLMDPMATTRVPKPGQNDVLILADDSASLALTDSATGKPAGEPLKEALKADAGWMNKVEETFRVHAYSFDDRLHERTHLDTLKLTGMRSALAGSLESLQQRYLKQPVAAVLLFTDGNATDAAKLEEMMANTKAPAPIFPVVTGVREVSEDLALKSAEVTQTPFEDSPVAITAKISATGLGDAGISLVIQDESGKVVKTEKHKLAQDQTEHTFQTRFRPEKMGVSFFKVSVVKDQAAPHLADAAKLKEISAEATMENNQRFLAIDRRSGPYRVLYVSGRPNWEYKFLRRSLEPDDEVKLAALIRMAKREPKFQWRGREGETSNPLFRGFKSGEPEEAQRYDQPVLKRLNVMDASELADGFPKTPEELFGKFRAVVLDDVEAEFFTREQLDLLERFVSVRGGSLVMLGGQESFRLGGYEHTPVGRMLPVYLDRAGEVSPAEEAQFSLTREGWLEPWMRLRNTEPEEESRMATMPVFYSVNQSTAIKPGASILATVTDARRKSHPAWVVQRYGNGRVAAVTVGDVWRWGLSDPKSQEDMAKAWRQLFRWLVVDVPDRVDMQISITPSGSHELVKPQVRVRDLAFRPQDDATVSIEIQEPDGGRISQGAEPAITEAGLFEMAAHAGAQGAYRVKATVKDSTGAVVGESNSGWALNPAAEEFASLLPNRPLLERVAAWSGGRVLTTDDLGSWASELSEIKMPVMETRTEPLWHRWWVLVLLVALLGTEWWLRRRQGWR